MKFSLKILGVLWVVLFGVAYVKNVNAQQYNNYIWNSPAPVAITAENSATRDELSKEVDKIVQAGHLAPALFDTGGRTGYGLYMMATLAEVINALSMAYPYLPATLQQQVKTYLDNEIKTYPPHQYGIFPPTWGGHKLSDQPGTRREWYPVNLNRSMNIWPEITPSIESLYPIWLYSYATGDWTYAQNNWNNLTNLYNNRGQVDSYLKIAGVMGYARIAQQLGRTTEASSAAAVAESSLAVGLDFNQFLQTAKDKFNTQYTTPVFLFGQGFSAGAAGVFAGYFPREIGQFLRDNSLSQVQSYVQEITEDTPLWYLTLAGWGLSPRTFGEKGPGQVNYLGEDAYVTPEVSWTHFMIHTYILGDDFQTMQGYLDFPSRRGDLFHIQKLVATIEATPTILPPLRGDVNNDNSVDVLDVQACVNHILGIQDWGTRADVNKDGTVDVLDVQKIVNTILGVGG